MLLTAIGSVPHAGAEHQQMHRRGRVDVLEGQQVLVLVDLSRESGLAAILQKIQLSTPYSGM
jgi:hypothetical protein